MEVVEGVERQVAQVVLERSPDEGSVYIPCKRGGNECTRELESQNGRSQG